MRNYLSSIALTAALFHSLPASADQPAKSDFIADPEAYLTQEITQPKVDPKKEAALKKFIDNFDFYLTGPSEQYKLQQGELIKGILEEECDVVESYLREFHDGKDLIIVCYEEDGGKLVAEWAINLDNVCRAYAEVTTFVGIEISGLLITELSRGEVNSKKMGASAAKELVSLVSGYVHKYNDQRCIYWKEFIHQNYGPLGPASQRPGELHQ